MVKRAIIICSVGVALLASTSAWGVPKTARPKPAKSVPLDEIRVSTDDGGHGGAYGGAGSSWTLRSNDTMDHSESVSTSDMVANGAEGFDHVNGAMQSGSYARMLSYLQWTRLLDLKTPARGDTGMLSGGVNISLVRKGTAKSIRLTYGNGPTVDAAIWTTITLLNSLEAEIDWKNDKGLSLNTGLYIRFSSDAEGLPQSAGVEPPVVAIRNSKGKEVGRASVHSMAWADKVVMPPGTYHLQVIDTLPPPAGYAWHATLETVVVSAGKMTDVKIALQKKTNAP